MADYDEVGVPADDWQDWLPLARAAELETTAAARPEDPPAGTLPVAAGCVGWAGGCADPVFVLTAGRSGSTLLRFLLDAHPELACPPETELPALCSQLTAVWSLFAASLWPTTRGAGAAAIPEPVIAGMRHAVDLMVGPYLARRGKRRYCDKSLGSAHHADLLARMYPESRFVCLYRHPMDLIASGLEACPWGLNSYGFEHYIGASPGNAVAAIARYWADHTAAILAAEDQFPGHCHRVRYEDLVAAPDAVAGEIFGFLSVPPVHGIAARALSHERERFGRSDFKIWNTTKITSGSVGRGWSIPATMIPPPLLAMINDLAGRLGYRHIDETWGTGSRPASMLAPADGQADEQTRGDAAVPAGSRVGVPSGCRLLGERITAGLARLDDSFTRRWHPYSVEPFLVVAATPHGAAGDAGWLVDLSRHTATAVKATGGQAARWRVVGTADAWQKVISDEINLGVIFRRGDMRYSDTGGPGPGSAAADIRVAMMADLLGITTWPAGASQDPGADATEATQQLTGVRPGGQEGQTSMEET